jgi:hypothetical protein
MEAQMKRNSVINVTETEAGLTFTVSGAGDVALEFAKISPTNRVRAETHGWKQRISDAAAMSCDGEGRTASPMEKLTAMRALVMHYESGAAEWSRRAEAAGPRGGFLFEALSRMYPEADVRAYLDGLTSAEQAALRDDSDVAPVIATIKAERNVGKPKLDTKAILAGLR